MVITIVYLENYNTLIKGDIMEININNLKKIASGFTADVFMLDNTKVLKLYFEGWDVNYILNEYHVNCLIQSYSIKVPKAYEIVTVGSRTGIIFQKLQNITMKDKINEDKRNGFGYAKTLAQEHYRINRVTYSKNELAGQRDAYIKLIESRAKLNNTQKNKLIQLLKSLPDGNKICHGDFHPYNLLYEDDIIYIIDWVGALRGNPLADVAGSYLIMKIMGLEAEKNLSFLKYIISSSIIRKFADIYLKEYIRISNCSMNDIIKWIPIRAATYLDFGLPEKANKQLFNIINHYLK
jgi:uncharacterized protein (TIGR02172 family)